MKNRSVTHKKHGNLKQFGITAGVALIAGAALAQTPPTSSTNTFTVNQSVPVGSDSGLVNSQTLNFAGSHLYSITQLQVTLNISGGFTGDYYAYLVHDGSFVVLLNRSGTTSSNPVGYTDDGMNVTLADGSSDIHTYQLETNPGGGVLSGTFSPDGRNTDPSVTIDTTPRTTTLSSFNTDNPSGTWTLFVADLDYGEPVQLNNWGLVVTSVPEPTTAGLALLGLGSLWLIQRTRRQS